MLKQYLMQSRAALDEMSRLLDESRERALAEALSGVPKIVIASFKGQFVKKHYPNNSGYRIEYWMGGRLLIEEVCIHDSFVFHIHPQK